jgi:hypothetical protein
VPAASKTPMVLACDEGASAIVNILEELKIVPA